MSNFGNSNQFIHSNKIPDCFELEDVIGSGSYATVFHATSKSDPKKCFAVKKIKKNRISRSNETVAARAMKEAKLLAQISHANIVQYEGCYDEEDCFCIVTEYLQGQDLLSLIDNERIKERECRGIIQSILNAVKYLHNQNIVHRDIKLENVIYTSGKTVKLIDFGFAARVKGMSLNEGYGTMFYAAPEIYKKEFYGKPIDMWAIGVLAYCLIYKQYPFNSKDTRQLAEQIKSGRFAFGLWSYTDEIVSQEAKDFIARLLVINPLKRMTVDQALNHPWIKKMSFSTVATVMHAVQKWKKLGSKRIETEDVKEEALSEIMSTTSDSRSEIFDETDQASTSSARISLTSETSETILTSWKYFNFRKLFNQLLPVQ